MHGKTATDDNLIASIYAKVVDTLRDYSVFPDLNTPTESAATAAATEQTPLHAAVGSY
jgi:hypothetical protein